MINEAPNKMSSMPTGMPNPWLASYKCICRSQHHVLMSKGWAPLLQKAQVAVDGDFVFIGSSLPHLGLNTDKEMVQTH